MSSAPRFVRENYWRIGLRIAGIPASWTQIGYFLTLDETSARQRIGSLLLSQLRFFRDLPDAFPEWKRLAGCSVDELWDAWPTIPVLTKDDLQTRFSPQQLKRFGIKGRTASSGGSTGEPTHFIHDFRQQRTGSATRLYCWRQFGWRPGDAVLGLWGSERDIGKHRSVAGRMRGWLAGYQLVDGYGLDDRTVDRTIDILNRNPGTFVYGFTSILEFVAEAVIRRGIDVRGTIPAAWNGGEMLSPEQSAVFESAFGVPIRNLYGGRELGALAYESDNNGELAILRPFIFIEVIDENGRAVNPGESGRVICTHTYGRGSPFLRYEIGDMAAPGHVDSSGVRSLACLHGRSAGVLRFPNGRSINQLFWNHLFKDIPEVRQFQIAWINEEHLEIRLRGSGFSEERERYLQRTIRDITGGVRFEIRWFDAIPKTHQGKLLQVVREPSSTA